MRHLQDQNVLILGLGASGLAMARWCVRHGAMVTVADTRVAPPALEALQRELPSVTFIGGAFLPALVQGTAIRAVYRSPGLSPEAIAPVVDAARAAGLPVGNELDLFARALADLRDLPEAGEVKLVAAEQEEPSISPPAEALAEADELELPEASTALADDVAAEESDGTVVLGESQQEELEASAAEEGPAVDEEPASASLDDARPNPALAALLAASLAPALPGYRPAVLAITGTNGKTTVTSLTTQLLQRAGKTVAMAGNIGPTLLDTLMALMDTDALPEAWVLELSSFQLDGVQGFEPTAAVVLNISQDHLDWHGDMAAYTAAKARIFGDSALMLLNRDDARVMDMLPPPVKVRLKPPQVRLHMTFGAGLPQRPGDYGIETVNGMAWLVRAIEADETIRRRKGEEIELYVKRLMPVEALRIRGRHNATNALAALALAVAAGGALGQMLHGLREYQGEPHRVESLAVIDGVEYFDDSKGTNVGATAAALSGLGTDRKLVVILGGEGKGQDFSPLADPVSRFARAVVLIGRDAHLIRAALEGAGATMLDATSMEEAVSMSRQHAQSGDAVLMSPACASFDMFDNYEHRARVFADAVQALAQDAGAVL